ncbi:alpha/beta hydrolase [Caballeronia sp. DA-9]|uniref:alpha/beta hydrolase n=1 Tax=Caballeronia sp. DA-9 TaxID=3436237 RepID=UPI003F6651A8
MTTDPAADPEIESQYFFSARYPERQRVYDAIDRLSADVRDTHACTLDVPYGGHELERVDLFGGRPGAPLLVFIHGGYWRSMDKRSFSFVAGPFTKLGYSVAVLNYPLAPETPLPGIAASIDRALRWLNDAGRLRLPRFSSIVLAGHSAGGHLAALAATLFESSARDASPVAGCACISGIFDLEPLMKTSLASHIGLASADVETLSPIALQPFEGWMILGVGAEETAGFIDSQTKRFAACRDSHGLETTVTLLAASNHYTVLMDLARDDGLILSAIEARVNGANHTGCEPA